jgi:hypothetical protein
LAAPLKSELRKTAPFVVFSVLPLHAMAADTALPTETVVVDGNALVGVWRVDYPTWGRINLWGHASWGALQGNFCRVEQAKDGLRTNCFPNPGDDGTVSVDGTHFHMAWGSMMARLYMDGGMTTATAFDGHWGIKLSGLAIENPNLSHGEKLSLSAAAPDGGGSGILLTHLLDVARAGPLKEIIDVKSPFVQPPQTASLSPLGAIEAVIFLGILPKHLPPDSKEAPQADFFHVYDVEFANGHRLCGLRQRDDGVVDAFRCI